MTKFKDVGGTKMFRPWNKWNEGDMLVGKYVGTFIDNYDKEGYEIEVQSATFSDGEQISDGTLFGANSAGGFDRKMKLVPEGSIVQIVYNGKKALGDKHKFKGSTFHDISVGVTDDESVPERFETDTQFEDVEL